MEETPDELTIAAYLEGGLEDEERAAIERWLAASPEAVELVAACREVLDSPTIPAPQSFVAKLTDLPEAQAALDGAAAPPFWRDAYWPSAAALVLLSCLLGVQLAQTVTTEAIAGDPPPMTAEVVIDLDMTGGHLL